MLRARRRLNSQLVNRSFAESKEAKKIKDKEALLKAIDDNDVKVLKNSDLVKKAIKINDDVAWDDAGADGILTNEDDEFQWAGVEDPCVLITTSRDPSSTLKQFSKELHHLIPNSQRINRGNTTIEMLTEKCLKEQVTDMVIVEENRGVPTALYVSHMPHGPTAKFSLKNVVLRHQMQLDTVKSDGTKGTAKMPTQYPQVIFKGLDTKLGLRLRSVLKFLFPVAKPTSTRAVAFVEKNDVITFRHCTKVIEHSKETGKSMIVQNHGPQWDMTLFKLYRGILKNESIADIEYELRPFMNTANKRNFLSKE